MEISQLTSALTAPPAAEQTDGFEALNSTEFFQLIITDLLNQDPLEPMDNDKLLQQLSSIREMEMSEQITDSLRSLTEQQRVGAATTLIGQYVQSADGQTDGVVSGVQFANDGQAVLQLGLGRSLPLQNVGSVTSFDQLRAGYVDATVAAMIDQEGTPTEVRGTVTDVKIFGGEVMFELDSGAIVPASTARRVTN